MRPLRTILLLLCCVSCPGPSGGSDGRGPDLEAPNRPHGDPLAIDAGLPDALLKAVDAIGETEARSILADVFRGAGYRILYDVMVSDSVALDGFDPRKRVGYEYVAVGDSGAPSGIEAAGKVLVLGPSSREQVTERAKAFVKELAVP